MNLEYEKFCKLLKQSTKDRKGIRILQARLDAVNAQMAGLDKKRAELRIKIKDAGTSTEIHRYCDDLLNGKREKKETVNKVLSFDTPAKSSKVLDMLLKKAKE